MKVIHGEKVGRAWYAGIAPASREAHKAIRAGRKAPASGNAAPTGRMCNTDRHRHDIPVGNTKETLYSIGGLAWISRWILRVAFGAMLATASSNARAFETGHDLLEFATQRHEFMLYVAGVMEGHMLTAAMLRSPQIACPYPHTTRLELASAVISWIEANPQHLDNTARAVVLAALIKKFPCK